MAGQGAGPLTAYREVTPRSRKAWRAWLQRHHATSSGVWLRFAKKHTGIASPSYNDAVEEALCFGWIDSLMRPVDAAYYRQLFTPRKPKSAWAQTNKARVERLMAAGLMTAAGMAAIEAAKASGSWDALTAAESLIVPPALQRALNANPRAAKQWPAFTASQRKQFLYYLSNAKRPDTRARRIARIVTMAANGTPPAVAAVKRPSASRARTT